MRYFYLNISMGWLMNTSVFMFKDFRKFLLDIVKSPATGRGIQARWAAATLCQPAYISHVLKGRAEFSLEQAEALSNYLNLKPKEKEYFLNLIQYSRAGTSSLKSYLKSKLDAQKAEFDNLKQRINIESKMNLEDQILYYSRWQYSAVHMCVMLPEMSTVQKISQRLSISTQEAEEALEILLRLGLIAKTSSGWKVTNTAMHLENNSPLLKSLHTQWRLKSIDAISLLRTKQDLRYSGCVALARTDLEQIKEILTQAIEKSIAQVLPSPEETLAVMNVDFFEI
ncbi:hypothetical protein DOM22_17585 [Bdellovibrio sp. ZAP7]|nr:hypothetical protein DOM22_17585 [Bdellovibrio sp. ZAP7]